MTAPIVPNTKVAQEKFRDPAAEITCASMRADELRGCLIREISRTIAIGLQAHIVAEAYRRGVRADRSAA